jgi:hypothetical protein
MLLLPVPVSTTVPVTVHVDGFGVPTGFESVSATI